MIPDTLEQFCEYFKDEKTCLQYISDIRWPGGVICLYCGAGKCYITKIGYRCRVKSCSKKFNELKGTLFEESRTSIQYWFITMFLSSGSQNGITAAGLSKLNIVSRVTGWALIQRIEFLLLKIAPDKLIVKKNNFTSHTNSSIVLGSKNGRPNKFLYVKISFEEMVEFAINKAPQSHSTFVKKPLKDQPEIISDRQ